MTKKGWTGEDDNAAQTSAPPPLSIPQNDTPADDDDRVPLGAVLEHMRGDAVDAAAQEAADALLKTTRTAPHALDAERSLLGAILLSSSVLDDVLDQGLVPGDFYRPSYGTIFTAMLNLRARGEPVDVLTVIDELVRRGQIEAIGGAQIVTGMQAMLPTTAHAAAYARLVHQKAVLRKLIETGSLIVQSAFRQDRTVEEILQEAERSILEVGMGSRRLKLVDRRATIDRVLDNAMNATDGKKPDAPGSVSTGFPDLDVLLRGGFRPGQQIIVAARPAMGKTTFCQQLAAAAADRGCPAGIVSLEMGGDELLERELAQQSRADPETWHQREAGARVMGAAGFLYDRALPLSDDQGLTLAEVCSVIRRMHVQHGIGLAVVDHVGKIVPGERYRGNRNNEIEEVSRQLHALANQLKIRMVLAVQLNREVEKRKDKRPIMSDLRDAGALEQDANVVLLLHRPEYYMKEETPEDLKRVAEVIVAKNRAGPCEIVRLFFDGPTTRFNNRKRKAAESHGGDEEE